MVFRFYIPNRALEKSYACTFLATALVILKRAEFYFGVGIQQLEQLASPKAHQTVDEKVSCGLKIRLGKRIKLNKKNYLTKKR